MLFKDLIGAQLSGRLGGIIASHNRGGSYFRVGTIPTDPASAFQVTVRNAMAQLSTAWGDVLTAAQRDGWTTYGINVPVINRLGDPIQLTGLQQYQRSNVIRLQNGLVRVDVAPSIFDIGSFTDPSFALDEPNDEVDVTFDNTDAWANEDDSAMLIFASRPKSLTTNFFKNPYRVGGSIDGDAITAPTSPAAISLPFPVTTSQRIFLRVAVTRADGRLSASFRGSADA